MAEFEFENRLRLALREAAEREMQRGRVSRSAASGSRALRVTLRRAPAAVAVAVTLLALTAAAAVLLTFGQGERKPVRPPQIVGRLTLADSLGLAVSTHGSLWIDDRSDNRLLRLDPATRRVVARIPVSDDVALAVAGDSLWALPNSHPSGPGGFRPSVQRIDVRTSRVSARISLRTPSGEPFAGSAVAANPNSVWILGATARMFATDTIALLRIDPRTGRATALVQLPGAWGPADIALRGTVLWMITGHDRLLSFDARTGAKLSDIPLGFPPDDPAADPEPGRLGFIGSRLVVTARGGLAGIDPAIGRVVWRRRIGHGVQAWTAAGGLIWASANTGAADRLFGVNPANGSVASSVALSAFGTAGIAAVGQEVWVTTDAGKAVILRR